MGDDRSLPALGERALRYVPKSYAVGGKLHEIVLPDSFDAYLAGQFSSKHRGNLRRTLKTLRDASGGTITLERFDRPGDGARFFDAALPVARATWQAQQGTEFGPDLRARLDDLAGRGLLRCYLLRVGDEPCAFVIGYKWHTEFHYIRIGYDPKFAKLSPGTALLYLLVEEMCGEQCVTLFSLGAGDFGYKAQFGNVHVEVGDVWLLRRTLGNRILRRAHGGFRDAVVLARDWVRARKKSSAAGAASRPRRSQRRSLSRTSSRSSVATSYAAGFVAAGSAPAADDFFGGRAPSRARGRPRHESRRARGQAGDCPACGATARRRRPRRARCRTAPCSRSRRRRG